MRSTSDQELGSRIGLVAGEKISFERQLRGVLWSLCSCFRNANLLVELKKGTQENNVEWGKRMSFTFVPGLKLNYNRGATVQSIGFQGERGRGVLLSSCFEEVRLVDGSFMT